MSYELWQYAVQEYNCITFFIQNVRKYILNQNCIYNGELFKNINLSVLKNTKTYEMRPV
jgi:hypothetical protein